MQEIDGREDDGRRGPARNSRRRGPRHAGDGSGACETGTMRPARTLSRYRRSAEPLGPGFGSADDGIASRNLGLDTWRTGAEPDLVQGDAAERAARCRATALAVPGLVSGLGPRARRPYFAGTTCLFVLHGNVHDLVRQDDASPSLRQPGRLSLGPVLRLLGRGPAVRPVSRPADAAGTDATGSGRCRPLSDGWATQDLAPRSRRLLALLDRSFRRT